MVAFYLVAITDDEQAEVYVEANYSETFYDVCPIWAHGQLEDREVDEGDDGAYYDIFLPQDTFNRLFNQPEGEQHMSNQNYARDIDDMEMQCAPTKTIGVSTMSQEVISNITYYRGRNIKDMSKVQLIEALKGTEAEIKALDEIQTESAAITKEKDKLKGALAVVVAELDARS